MPSCRPQSGLHHASRRRCRALPYLTRELHGLGKSLTSEAVEGFANYASTFKMLQDLALKAKGLDAIPAGSSPAVLVNYFVIRRCLYDVARLLSRFSGRIDALRPYLGPMHHNNHGEDLFFEAAAKVTWPRHAAAFGELSRKLEGRFGTVQRAVMRIIGIPKPEGDYFVFECARGTEKLMYFVGIPDWEDLHEFLLRVHHETEPGHHVIESKSYLFYNATTKQNILPDGPYLKPLRDLVSRGDRVEVTAILPNEHSYTTTCPGCGTERPAGSLVEVKCPSRECRLKVRFEDSYDNEVDPLTQLAIDAIREKGARSFVDDEMERSGLLGGKYTVTQLKEILSSKFPPPCPKAAGSQAPSSAGLDLAPSSIMAFPRVALCTPQWPKTGSFLPRVETYLDRVMEGVKRTLGQMRNGWGLPMLQFARAVRSDFAGGRTEEKEAILQCAVNQYKLRKTAASPSWPSTRFLLVYSLCAQESESPFHPSVVRARCLLWLHFHAMALEQGVVLHCAKILEAAWPSPADMKPSLFGLALSSLFVPHVLIARVTLDVVADAAGLVTSWWNQHSCHNPSVKLAAVLRILEDSRSLCLDYCLDGDLRGSDLDLTSALPFEKATFPSAADFEGWREQYRRCLEGVMENAGTGLVDDPGFYFALRRGRWMSD